MKRRQALWIAVWAGGVLAAAGVTAGRLSVENPSGQWHPRPPPPEERLWQFAQAQFGDREVLLVAVRLPRPAPGLAQVRTDSLERWIARQAEVDRVFGPSDARRLGGGALTRLLTGTTDDLRRAVLSPDGTVALHYVILKPSTTPSTLNAKTALLSRLGTAAATRLPPGAEMLLAGKPVLDVGLNDLLKRDAAIAAPLALATMLLALSIALGRRAVAPTLGVAAALLILLGILAAAAIPISTATVVALPITVVLGLSYGIHTEAEFARFPNHKLARARLARPLGWAYATTAVALLTFLLSPIPAFRSFAWATAGGVSIAFLAAMSLVPAVAIRPARASRKRGQLLTGTFRLFALTTRHPLLTTGGWLLLGVGTSLALGGVHLEPNNYLGFFSSGHPVAVAHRELDRAFGGSVPLEVMAEADSGVAWRQPRVRERLAVFAHQAARYQVGLALLPIEPKILTRRPELGDLAASWFLALDPRYTRALLTVPVLPTPELRQLLGTLDSLAAVHSDRAVQLRVTGVLPASLPLLRALVDTQLRSLGGLVAVVAVALLLAAPTVRTGLLLLAPNFVPLLAVGAAMATLAIPLDFTTVSIFSILLGVAVDDTLHIAWAARSAAGRGTLGVVAAMRREAAPVTLSSLTAVAGFASLLLSPFPATQRLGGLMALGLAVAWLADVTLTPIILAATSKRALRPDTMGSQTAH